MNRKQTQSRWMKSALREAAKSEVQMPFARNSRKSLLQRRGEAVISPLRRVAVS